MNTTIRLLMIDDHQILREGLRTILEMHPHLKVVGEASDADEALARLNEGAIDVVLTDLSLPGQNGFWLIEQLKKRSPTTYVLVLTMSGDDQSVLDAFRAGADGYLTKSSSGAEIVRAIETVAGGRNYLQPTMVDPLVRVLRQPAAIGVTLNEDLLTTRELETLQFLAQGYKNSQIADQMMLSISTVKSHLRTLFTKLQVSDRSQAVLEGVRRGLISTRARDEAPKSR